MNLQFITRRIEVNRTLVNKYLLVKNYWKAKLSNREVETLRQMVESGELTQKQAAEKFEISKGQVSKIINHKQR